MPSNIGALTPEPSSGSSCTTTRCRSTSEPAPLTGIGPLVLGEVERRSLDTYARLDAAPVATDAPVAANEPVVQPSEPATTKDEPAPADSPSAEKSRHGT